MSGSAKKYVSIFLVVLGVAFAVAGMLYLTKSIRDLPDFLPGRPSYIKRLEARAGKPLASFDKKLTKRGVAVEVIALLCFVGAWYTSGLRKTPAPEATPEPTA